MVDDSIPFRVERYRQLIRAMDKLSSILDPDLILDYVASAATILGEAEFAWILMPDARNQALTCQVTCFNDDPSIESISTPIDSSLEGWVHLHQQPLIINDLASSENGNKSIVNFPGREIRSILILPVSFKAKRLFILEVANHRKGEFSPFDQEILLSFSHHAAICLDKCQRLLQADLIPELVHELRTPLAALNTALHLLQRPDLPEGKRAQLSQIIQIEFTRLSDLTTSFLDYARLESGKEIFRCTRFDINELITDSIEILKMQSEARDLKIAVNHQSGSLYLTADRDKIKQVIINLLSNAIKYNCPGGKITLSASGTPDFVSFSVQDTGPGIPTEFIPRLFERFYRVPKTERQIKGTGLGLTICKQIIDAHNGRIEVSSNLGEGTTFSVHLPVNSEK